METGKGMILDGADGQPEDTGELAGAQDQSAALAPLYEKIERVLDGDRPVAALLADLSPETTNGLLRQAHAANASQMIGAGADISLASQNAPKAFASDGNYAGVMPGPEAFVSVYGAKEGGRQFAKFDQEVKAGMQAFEMLAMPDRDIKAQLLEAAAAVGHSPDGQSRYQVTAAAAQQALEARRNDPAGQASKAFPQVDAAWRAASDRGWQDTALVQHALAVTVAAQRYLGIKNIQPVPQSVLKGFGGLPPQEVQARMNGLQAGTADPVVKLAMSRQFAEAGLVGGLAMGPEAAPLGQDGLGDRIGLPSKPLWEGENASPVTRALAQSNETLGANNSPGAADDEPRAAMSGLIDSDLPAGLTQALPEQMNPPPERPDVVSDNTALSQSDDLSKKWVGHSTTNISLLPEDIQGNVKPYIDLLGRNFGNGECAALTKEVGGMSATSTWKKGEKIQGNKTILPGTPIATFNGDWGDGRGKVHYGPKGEPGGKSGQSHTGIYLGQDEDGIYIIDQWNNRKRDENGNKIKVPQRARITYRPWEDKRQRLESGSHYYVIEK